MSLPLLNGTFTIKHFRNETVEELELKSTIVVRGGKIGNVHEFIYSGRFVKLSKGTEADVRRRIRQSWKAFFNDKGFCREKKEPMSLKRKPFEKSVMPTVFYDSETSKTTKICACY